MKAYMSVPGTGPWFLDGSEFCDAAGLLHSSDSIVRSDDFAAAWAVREAERILAETEPFVASADWFNVGRKSDTEHSQCGRLAMCSPMYQALAESLRAFVGEGQ